MRYKIENMGEKMKGKRERVKRNHSNNKNCFAWMDNDNVSSTKIMVNSYLLPFV